MVQVIVAEVAVIPLAATALMRGGVIEEIRIAAASLAPFPARMAQTEASLAGQKITAKAIESARKAVLGEAQPIDDIRSTAQYRKAVGANLLEEFLRELGREAETP